MSHEHHIEVDPIEAAMSPLELIKHRLSSQVTTLVNLQTIVLNTIPAVLKDIGYCMQVIEAIEAHLPKQQQQGHAGEALGTAPATHAPTAELPAVRFDTPAAQPAAQAHAPAGRAPTLASMAGAATAAQAAVNRVGEAMGVRTPASQSPVRPTRVAPADQHQPTTQAPAPQAQQSAEDFSKHFYGSGSIFAKFLSPSVFALGRGFTEPGRGGLEQYNEDVLRMTPRDLEVHQWPTGFYRDAASRLQQLLIRNNKVQVIISNLPNADALVQVSFAPFTQRLDARQLSDSQGSLTWSTIHAAFLAVERAAGNTNIPS